MEGVLELTGITIVALAAMICGMVMSSLRQPAIVGYIFAGVILGPTGLGLVDDREQVQLFAELGVLMLLYFIGMELSLRSFRHTWRIALLTTAIQLGGSVCAMLLFMKLLGWPVEQAVLFGFVLALSSTAVAVRMLEDVGELRTRTGRITVGVLIAQDLAVAPMLLIVGGMAGGEISHWVLAKVGMAIAILTAVILFLSGKRKINLLFSNLLTTKPDLAPLMALCGCFGFAAVAGLIGLSPPFGAFLAGLIIGNSAQRQIVYQMAKPIESILMMVFFLSIGLLVDLPFIWNNFGTVLLLWLFIAVFKSALNMGALRLLGEPWQVAFLSSVMLAQIGEFSFVLGAAAIDHAIINTEVHRLIVAVTVLSLISSPLYMATARRLQNSAVSQIDSLSRLLHVVYFKEWQVTRRATTRLVGATRQTARQARRMTQRHTGDGGDIPDVDAAPEIAEPDGGATLPPPANDEPALAPEPANDAEMKRGDTAEQPEASDGAGLQPGTPGRRKGRRGRRSGARAVGGPGGRGGGDP